MTDEGFSPTLEMLLVLDEACKATDRTGSYDPEAWCTAAGLHPSAWDGWLGQWGDVFIEWFSQCMDPTDFDRACMDRLFWSAMRNVMAEDRPPAAHLKLWADLMGHFDKKPDRREAPILSAEEATDLLVGLGTDTLTAMIDIANQREQERRKAEED